MGVRLWNISVTAPPRRRRSASQLGKQLRPGAVIAYEGGLRHGKNGLHARPCARACCRGRVTSPTFTIVNEYEGRIPLFHFDMYRLDSADALFDIGWDDYLERGGVCAVEWSENVADAIPPDAVRVAIERAPGGDDCRRITITGGEPI